MDRIKVIAAVEEGSVISPFYDNLIAQVIAHGDNRSDTVAILGSLDFVMGECDR